MRLLTLQSTRLVTDQGPHANYASPGVRNMYGCLPCHRCGGGERMAYSHKLPTGRSNVIRCYECGHVQKAVFRWANP